MEFDNVITKGGDDGFTDTFSGERISKSSLLIELNGKIDLLSSMIGEVRSYVSNCFVSSAFSFQEAMRFSQVCLYNIGALVSTDPKPDLYAPTFTPTSELYKSLVQIGPKETSILEAYAKKMHDRLTISQSFIIPGDGPTINAKIDILRAFTREVEVYVWKAIKQEARLDLVASGKFLNRLSDLLFFYGRAKYNEA